MTKILITGVALLGTWILIGRYAPSLSMQRAFEVQGYQITWALIALAIMGVVVWKKVK